MLERLLYFLNTGTADMQVFEKIHHDFALLSEFELTGIHPSFADLDGDGDEDMLVGNEDGTLFFYENTAGQGNTMNMVLRETFYFEIDVGNYSAPQLIDLNKDGISDLVLGERGGNLNYFQNTGTTESPEFQLVTDSLGKVNVTDYNYSLYGYSRPFFFDVEWRISFGGRVGAGKGFLLC